mmetsp:Transcript_69108/g.202356  ORF Transcript_69108/g.202356 Transcript_69108/m.202356 type:complete len:202 (+) Transcript_69108:757-1362(+)
MPRAEGGVSTPARTSRDPWQMPSRTKSTVCTSKAPSILSFSLRRPEPKSPSPSSGLCSSTWNFTSNSSKVPRMSPVPKGKDTASPTSAQPAASADTVLVRLGAAEGRERASLTSPSATSTEMLRDRVPRSHAAASAMREPSGRRTPVARKTSSQSPPCSPFGAPASAAAREPCTCSTALITAGGGAIVAGLGRKSDSGLPP